MPSEDREPNVSEMPSHLDSLSGNSPEDLPAMSEPGLEYPTQEEIRPEQARYRVRLIDAEVISTPVLYIEYFSDYDSAYGCYSDLCDNEEYVKHHKTDLSAEIQIGYRGHGEIFWETVLKSSIYTTD